MRFSPLHQVLIIVEFRDLAVEATFGRILNARSSSAKWHSAGKLSILGSALLQGLCLRETLINDEFEYHSGLFFP